MNIRNIISAALLFVSTSAGAQECAMPVLVQLDEDFTNVPEAASTVLYQTLNRIATENGLSTESPSTPFVLTVHCDVTDKANLPGPPVKTVYNLGLTFYMADMYTKKKFSTAYITVDGVGTGEVKSYINAFKRINGNSSQIQDLINKGKKKMIEYYDTQYRHIIKEAERLASLQNYEEALTLVLSIPVCSKGGDAASKYGLELYTRQLDRMNLFLLNRARAIWAAGQNDRSAVEACELLSNIDPDAACYGQAQSLMAEIKKQVRSDIDFEMRQKYNDQVRLESDRIAAARAVGVAFGNGQKPTTTNLMWLR